MEKIVDREEKEIRKRNKTWGVIAFTNLILVVIVYLIFSESIQGVGQLIIVGIGMVSIIFINLIIASIIRLFTDSKDWKKWGITSLVSFIVSFGFCFSVLF